MTDDQTSRPEPRLLRAVLLTVGGLTALILVAVGVIGLTAGEDQSEAPSTGAGDLSEVTEHEVEAEHVIEAVDYEQTPPVGGAHNPLWLNCGVYDERIPSENAVHSMEHGAAWITYDPSLSDEEVALLEERTPSTYAILSPFEGLPSPVVVSAWGRQLVLESAEDPRLQLFLEEFRQGGVAPEIGAPCDGASDGTLPLDAVEGMG